MNLEPGSSTEIELPLGQYTIASKMHRMVFIATGTGLAPFLPMFRQLLKEGALDLCQLLFGCRTAAEDITAHLGPLPATVTRCFSRDQAPPGGLQGRVTDALAGLTFDAASTDFYICGSSVMVADAKLTLEGLGASNILIETY